MSCLNEPTCSIHLLKRRHPCTLPESFGAKNQTQLYRHDAMPFHGTGCFPGCDYRTARCPQPWKLVKVGASWLAIRDLGQVRSKVSKVRNQDCKICLQLVLLGDGEPFQALELRLVKRRRWGLRLSWRQTLIKHVHSMKTDMAYAEDMCQKTCKRQGQIGSWHEQVALPETSMPMDLTGRYRLSYHTTHIRWLGCIIEVKW